MATLTQQQQLAQLELQLKQLEAQYAALNAQEKDGAPPKSDAPASQAKQAVLPSSGYYPAMAGARGPTLDPEAMGLVRDMALEGGGATAGQAIGAMPMLSVPTLGASIPIGGFIGGMGGNIAAQKARGQDIQWGEAVGAGVSGLWPGPSGSLGRAGAKTLAKEAGKQAVGNLAATATTTGIDDQRLPTLSESASSTAAAMIGTGLAKGASSGVDSAAERAAKMKSLNYSDRDFTIRLAGEAGYVFDPVKLNPNAVTKAVDRLAVESSFHKAAIAKNQEVTNQLVRSELGLYEGDSLNNLTLDVKALELRQPYEQIRAMGTEGKDAVQELIEVRKKARTAWEDYRRNRTRDALSEAESMDSRAEAIEDKIEKIAQKAGVPQAVDELRASRKALAKVYVVQNALNSAANEVDASIIGKVYDKNPKMLDGSLATIGKVANIQPYMFRPSSEAKASTGGAGRIMGMGMGMSAGAYAGSSVGGAAGAAAGALAGGGIGAFAGGMASDVLSVPFTKLATSPGYQRVMAMPRYNQKTPEALPNYILQAAKSAGR